MVLSARPGHGQRHLLNACRGPSGPKVSLLDLTATAQWTSQPDGGRLDGRLHCVGMNKAAGVDIWSRPGESTIARVCTLSLCARRLNLGSRVGPRTGSHTYHVFPAEPSIKIGSQALIHAPPVGECSLVHQPPSSVARSVIDARPMPDGLVSAVTPMPSSSISTVRPLSCGSSGQRCAARKRVLSRC